MSRLARGFFLLSAVSLFFSGEVSASVLKPVLLEGVTPLPRSLGAPDLAHNTPYAAIPLSYSGADLEFRLTPEMTLYQSYAIWGAKNSHHYSFAYPLNDGLCLQGDSHVAFKFEVPGKNSLTGGTMTVTGRAQGRAGGIGDFYVAVGADLIMAGANGFWDGPTKYNEKYFKKVSPVFGEDGTFSAELPLPEKGSKVFVVLSSTSGDAGLSDSAPVIESIRMSPRFALSQGMAFSYDPAEPVWTHGEQLDITVSPAGLSGETVRWSVTNLHTSASLNGVVDGGQPFGLDLTGLEAGFYALSCSGGSMTDGFEFAVLAPQDQEAVAKSVFGTHGAANRRGRHGDMGTPDAADLDLMHRMGVRWSVFSRLWAWTQSERGGEVDPEYMDRFRLLNDNGFELICNVGSCPKWANDSRASAPPKDSYLDDWSDYNEELARTAKGVITWFQAWNEPNNPNTFWMPPPFNKEKRSLVAKNVQRAQYKGIKKGNPDAKLIGGTFAGLPADWVETWLSNPSSTRDYQDAMSGHPYCKVTREDNWEHRFPAEPDLVPRLREFRQAMDDNGAEDQPLFLTEYGWYTPSTSPVRQAAWTARQNVIVQALRDELNIQAHCIFAPDDIKNGHNLFIPPRDLKLRQTRLLPVIGSFAKTASVFCDARLIERISDYPSSKRVYFFDRPQEKVLAAWVTEQAGIGSFQSPFEGRQVALVNGMMGDESLTVLDAETPVVLSSSHEPVYYRVHKAAHPVVLPQLTAVELSDGNPGASFELSAANAGVGEMSLSFKTDVPWLSLPVDPVQITSDKIRKIEVDILEAKFPGGMQYATILVTGNDGATRAVRVVCSKSK
ncbi:glycoside hydrolase family 5 protein [Tichowtungia aerotolerans]|uniref:Uncharacterized protein n=1 Tax=Tichowtungia aerotolerans TaxID=2697043 RepID=A0A6P1MA86_9BACT|nr:hypothetical protein [Tichowtungia aerotolerans]QHI68035.1 hypothetical protein GT409_00735 [Tichowtungia aerotolerans]